MKMLHGKKLIMYFKNFQNENQCLLGTQYNCEGFGIYFIAILLIGTKRCKKKKKITKRLGTLVHNPNFNIVAYCAYGKFMRGNKLVLDYCQHIATCFPKVLSRFH